MRVSHIYYDGLEGVMVLRPIGENYTLHLSLADGAETKTYGYT